MNNRLALGLVGALAAIAILLGIVQSSNLGQAQADLALAQHTATEQAAGLDKQATLGAQFITAAAAEATGAYQTAATAQANAVGDAVQAAATGQAQALASAAVEATGTLSVIVAQASTAQADVSTAAADEQAQALASAAAAATTTLGAAVEAGATTQAEAVATTEARLTETLIAVIADASNTQHRLERTLTAQAADNATLAAAQADTQATQVALEALLTEVSGQLATVTANPTATLQPTAVVSKPQTPTELCAAAVPASDPETLTFRAPKQVLEPNVDYFAILCTGAGAVYIDLTEKLTPVTVNNFVFLAQAGYYNNTTFHRVIANFMAQGGDPTGTGTGGPGYDFGDEIVPSLRFDVPGRLAMANAGPNTNGSQFFITFGPQTYLDGDYSIFGQVVEGQANLRQIDLRDPQRNPREAGTALDTVLIITDPSLVKLTDSTPPTQADVARAMDSVDNLITTDLVGVLEHQRLDQTTEEVIAAAPRGVQADLGAFFDTYHHLYRVGSVLNNLTCDAAQIQFISAGYTLDAYATEADAAAAIADPVLEQMALKSGFDAQLTSDMLPHPYFTVTETVCDQRVIRAMTFWRHGTFISTVSIVLPADIDRVTDVLDVALVEFVAGQIYEPFLTDILYSGIE